MRRSGSGGSDTLSLGEGGVVDTTEGVPVTETLGGRHMQHRVADSQIGTHLAAIVQNKDFLGEPLSGVAMDETTLNAGTTPLSSRDALPNEHGAGHVCCLCALHALALDPSLDTVDFSAYKLRQGGKGKSEP
ncbi:hypothetical protein QL093DRAFT_2628798 [Fusarium oxysporum]|nr:hypothetical protein QL093DRAFT_2628798 [Fusarium oxysporum]